MGKRQLCIYADDNLVEIAKAKGWNMSELFNSMLQGMINMKDDEKISLNELNKEEIELQSKLNQIKAKRILAEKDKAKTIVFESDDY